jgi:hypothetical protein
MTQKMDAVNALLDIEVSPNPELFLPVFRIHIGPKLSIRIRPCNLPQCGSGHLTGVKTFIFLFSFFKFHLLF